MCDIRFPFGRSVGFFDAAVDIGLPNVRVGADEKEIYAYAKQVRRAKTYFRNLRNHSDVTQGWYVAYVMEDEEGQYAVAGYGGNLRGVHVPAHLDGYEVRGIDITNHHLASQSDLSGTENKGEISQISVTSGKSFLPLVFCLENGIC